MYYLLLKYIYIILAFCYKKKWLGLLETSKIFVATNSLGCKFRHNL